MRRILKGSFALTVATAALATFIAGTVFVDRVDAHGDVAPQPVDTEGLPALGEEWLEENPWRDPSNEFHARAIEVGASGYNQNCARCHGLEAVSGGLAPDLRFLEANWDGDDWYKERFINGFTQNGITKMPGFGDILNQEAAWAIRTYMETRPDEGALDDHVDRLKQIRDELQAMADGGEIKAEAVEGMREEMRKIGEKIPTGSGAPVADSIATRAAQTIGDTPDSLKTAAEILTVGLSAAQ